MLLQFDLKHIHKVNFYPSDNNFTQALLVMLVTNIISELVRLQSPAFQIATTWFLLSSFFLQQNESNTSFQFFATFQAELLTDLTKLIIGWLSHSEEISSQILIYQVPKRCCILYLLNFENQANCANISVDSLCGRL